MSPLPGHHHQDDAKWITERLLQLPSHMRQGACDKYAAIYQDEHDKHTGRAYAHCRARFAANTRLREFVERVQASLGGAVQSPPSLGHRQGKLPG